ncbi:MAG: FliH/SctL family protein [Planctomycetota bacterium]
MSRPLMSVRAHASSEMARQVPAVRRLLRLRDMAHEQELARQATEACAAGLQDCLRDVRAAVDARLDEVATLATELGLAVAREIVGDAVGRAGVDPLPAIRRSLGECVAHGSDVALTVHVAAADHERVAALAELQGVRLAVDANLANGSVRIETRAGSIAYDPQEVLQRVSDELRRELAACP